MTTYSLRYDITPGPCACGEDLDRVRAVIDDKPVCGVCLADDDAWSDMIYYIDPMDRLDTVLGLDDEDVYRLLNARNVVQVVHQMVQHRVPDAAGALLDDETFARELVHRTIEADIAPKATFALVDRLIPELPEELLEKILEDQRDAAAAGFARSGGDIVTAKVALIVLGRASAEHLGDAVEELGIDFDTFHSLLLAKSIELGKPVDELPGDVVDKAMDESRGGER